MQTDKNGIAMWDYKGRYGLHTEYVPWVISFYALGMHSLYQETQKKTYLERFFNHADFLVDNLVEREKVFVRFVKPQ